eukprot:jgi/Botrbrau1/4119/Bobra.152_3s0065.1
MGPYGCGKTSTINSLLGLPNNASPPVTKDVNVAEGVVEGIKFRFIDTPGLELSATATRSNQQKLRKMKGAMNKYNPDILCFVDRVDVLRRDGAETQLVKQISDALGKPVWFNCLLAMTHAATAPPDGPNGAAQSWETFVQARGNSLLACIRQAIGDVRLQNPIIYVENHPNCRKNSAGKPVLPNNQEWIKGLLLLCVSSKILKEADSLLRLKEAQHPDNALSALLRGGFRLPPIPNILSKMVSPSEPKAQYPPEEQEILRVDQIRRIREEYRRRNEMRKRREFLRSKREERKQEESGHGGGNVSIPAPDPQLPPTFEADTTSHRYRTLESQTGWITRPYVEQITYDHDDGIETVLAERHLVLRPRTQYLGGAPLFLMTQIQKDKTQSFIMTDAEVMVPLVGGLSLLGGADMTHHRDSMYSGHLDARLEVLPWDQVSAGYWVARLVEDTGLPNKGPVAKGLKLENRIKVGPYLSVHSAYAKLSCKTRISEEKGSAGNAEVRFTFDDQRNTSLSFGASFMNFREFGTGWNGSMQFNATPLSMVAARFNVNNKNTGNVVVHITSHDHMQLAAAFLLPLGSLLLSKIRGDQY